MSRGLGRAQRFAFEHLRHVNGWCPVSDLVDAYAARRGVAVTRSLAVAVRHAISTLSGRYGIQFKGFLTSRPAEAGGRRYHDLVRLAGTPDTFAGKSDRWLYGQEFHDERVRWRTFTRTPRPATGPRKPTRVADI
jgi:hypothetical protein